MLVEAIGDKLGTDADMLAFSIGCEDWEIGRLETDPEGKVELNVSPLAAAVGEDGTLTIGVTEADTL